MAKKSLKKCIKFFERFLKLISLRKSLYCSYFIVRVFQAFPNISYSMLRESHEYYSVPDSVSL